MGDTYIPGFASATLQVVLDRLWDFMVREVGLLLDANDGFKKLERTLLRVQAMLDDVEQKEISHKAWKIWVRDLKDAAYEADELLDEIAIASSCTSSQQVNMSSFPSFKPHKMDSIQKKVDEIAREMEFLYVSKLVGSSQNRTNQRPPSASILLADERSFFGRDNEKTMMINSLLSREGEVVGGMENVSIVSVVGMAGIGKTTLAQIVYNDPQIREGFDSRMWVSVNNDFDVKRITKSIIESFTHEVVNLIDLDSLQVTLGSLLAGKKFLLVLDDMWNESYHDWDVLQAPFRVGAPGSKILITTRSHVASKILIPSCIISLQSLSIKDSWLLFRSRAFGNRDPAEIPPNLISIGKEIVRKSKGLPLVAKTLGSLLNSVVDEDQWNTISRSEIWDFQEDESNILSALKLSYQYLPSHLKQCFAYCAIFPKGYKFEKEKIVLLWMAQGFLPAKGGRRMEDVGSDWFNSLVSRSFFQEQPSGPGGSAIYLMHDLIQDLAKFVSGEECFGMEASEDSGQPYISRNVRHLSFLKGKVSASTYEALCRSQSIRTILLSSKLSYSIHDVPFKIFARLNCLRVLDLSLTRIEELPSSIGNLKHLRYLDLSMTKIKTLHKNLCSLCSLQTLKLVGCTELLGLPQGLSNLTNLRHLDLQSNVRITSMPQSIGKLTDLQTLSTFIAGVENGCQIGELKHLRSLRGTLCISNLENVGNMEQANQAGLRHKQHLRKLKLVWRDESNGDTVLAGLRPHSNMEELHVVYYNGAVFPGWIADSLLVNLVAITLENCRKCVFLPPLGQLPALKSLVITNMPSVEYIDESFCGVGEVMGFPSLETLELDNMQNFLRWDGLAEGNIPRLQKLSISSCIKLEAVPNILFFTTLENFEVSHCPEVQVFPKEDVPSSLKCLIVNSCSLLRRWYESEGSGDLQVIAHNREVTIDGLRIS